MPRSLPTRPRTSRRFVYRPFRRRDVASLDEAIRTSLTDLQRWLPWAVGYDRSTSQRFVRESMSAWAEGRAFDFAIRPPDDPDHHLGNVSIWWVSQANLIGEIGYWVRSDETGRGIATEATARMVQLGFEELHLHKVVLRIAVGNTASERIAEKLGFTREGLLRDEVRVGDRWIDHSSWSLLEHEWADVRSRLRAEGRI